MVGEQAAGSPTLSTAPAWAWTLQGKEGAGRGECKPCPHAPPPPTPHPHPAAASLSSPPRVGASREPRKSLGRLVQKLPRPPVPGEGTGCTPQSALTCSFSSCSPRVEMPPVEVRRGVLGRRHTRFSRSQDTLGFRVRGQQRAQETW